MSRTVRSNVDSLENSKFSELVATPHRHGVEAPPALVAIEHVGLPEIHAEPRRIDDDFGQRRDILQAHVEALPRDRMNHMRGVADQRQPLAR